MLAVLAVAAFVATETTAATWQYRVEYERGPDKRGRPQEPGDALLWMPPESETIRAVLLCGQLGIEGELIVDPQVRDACRKDHVAIAYFAPHLSGIFHYWEAGNHDGQRLLKALDDLARQSGHEELRRVPWITAGHSTAGIFARNVAYWHPERTAGVIHIKSGNFHQKEHLPPHGSIAGVPLAAINGQFEAFGPEGGIRPEFGRETQWVFVLRDIQQFRKQDPDFLMSLVVQPGADHFHGSPELAAYVALFLHKTVQYRVPPEQPKDDAAIKCLPLTAKDGWLSDPDLYDPKHAAAAYDDYTGDRALALWYYDAEMAAASTRLQGNLGNHQVLSNATLQWLDTGDGWTFQAKAEFLDAIPDKYGGRVAGKAVGHGKTPLLYREKVNEPVEQIGPDRFRLLRPTRRVSIAAFHPGDDHFRATIRWSSIEMPRLKQAEQQKIEFPPLGDLKADSPPIRLRAKATSGLPIYYEIDYGPVVVQGEKLTISEIPRRCKYPMPCKVTAYQVGRRTSPAIDPAEPVSVQFQVVAP